MALYEWSDFAFDAPVVVTINTELSENEAATSAIKVIKMLREFERHFSRFITGSEVYRLNHARGKPMLVSEGLFELLSFSLSLANKSHGAFDPCVIDFLDAYGYKNNRGVNPHVIRALKNRRSSFRSILFDPVKRTVQLHPSQRIDLSAILKGYVVDLAAQVLLLQFQNFCIKVGRDMIALGHPGIDSAWNISVLNPFDDVGGVVEIAISNMGLSTTTTIGDSPSMLINPITGESVHDVVLVTVVAPSAIRADSLATTAFVLGINRGIAFLEREKGVEGMMISYDRKVLCTSGMKAYFLEKISG